MTIKDLKDLKKLMKLCQEHGVVYIKVDNMEFKVYSKVDKVSKIDYDAFPEADIPVPQYSPVNVQETASASIDPIDMPDELTEEQALFYSAVPEARQ